MKRYAIYILLTVYVFVQIKSIAVIVEDVLAHTFWKAKHMATVHYENGHYHIHAALSDISNEEQNTAKEKAPSSQKTNENVQQIISDINFNFKTNGILLPVAIQQKQNLLPGFTGINTPPPKTA